MTYHYGNVDSQEADLRLLFGPLAPDEEQALLEDLMQIDERLEQLAADASLFVGSSYRNFRLGVFGSEVAGGPSNNDAGDLWFEVNRLQQGEGPPLWEISARIVVFCDKELTGQTAGYSCTHDLLDLSSHAFTPRQAVRLLAKHIDTLESDLRLRSSNEFKGLPHDQLPGQST